ncbi:MAG: hypothetical protein JWM16_6353 [Verrucomicrobiales bacterium]|nr:hypothetical protein [Verrucomicrobiales bacterium]
MATNVGITQNTVLIDIKTGLPTRDLFLLLNYLSTVAADLSTLVVEDAINNGVTTKAPSENAVYDALATRDTAIAAVVASVASLTTTVNTKISTALTLTGTATYDPPSLADGAGTTTTVTVTGAVLGDMALASFSLTTSGITITAWVSASDTVSVRFQNESGGVLDIASGTLKAAVLR